MPRVDTRKMTREKTITEADEYSRCVLRIAVEEARTAARIADLEKSLAERTAAMRERRDELQPRVIAFLLSRKDSICAEKKKTIDTPTSKLGFRKCTDTVIEDPEAVVQFARDNGYNDLYTEPPPKLHKSAIRRRIDGGEDVPGALVRTDYEPFVQPQKTLLDRAKRGEE